MSTEKSRPSSQPPSPAGRPPTPRADAPGSTGPDGETRRGRRERERARDRSRARTYAPRRRPFLERHRGEILGLVAIAAIVLAGGFVFVQANSKTYACTTLTVPAPAASPLPNGSPAPLGQVQGDMGRGHILPPEFQRYTSCPPASGIHYAPPGGPITARYYGPDDATTPQGWIHNLEHGGLVILYSCDKGACDDATQQQLQAFFKSFPNSPVCNIPRGQVGPVIARFEEMNAPIAALLWGRVLFQQKLDTQQILDYYTSQAELKNPEPQCTRPTPSPVPGASAAPSESAAPTETAVPDTSAPPASAAPSTSPVASPAASPSPS